MTFKKIELPWITEALESKFDNAMQLLTQDCKIFGGSLRDLVAGLPILGDLDVLISSNDFSIVRRNFAESPNWIFGEQITTEIYKATTLNRLKVSTILNFKNVSNQVVQLIKIKNDDRVMEDNELILNNIKSVDMICCGLMLDMSGNLFEIVTGAQQDCKDKILRLNPFVRKECDKIKTRERVNKLINRGWISNIPEEELITPSITATVVADWKSDMNF